jgi:hypothetical protein
MLPLTLLDLCVRSICSYLHSDTLSLANLKIPPELRSKLLTNLLSSGMLTDCIFQQLLAPNFHTLQLYGAVRLTDQALLSIAQNCSRLRILELRRCPCVTGPAVRQIFENCIDLEELNLSQCFNVSDDAFVFDNETNHHHILRKLELLDISECHLVTDRAIESLAVRCSRLTSFCCASLPFITDDSVVKLLQQCTNLQVFDCSHCDEIGPETIQTLARFCPNVRILLVAGCYQIREHSIVEAVQRLTQLKILSLKECNQLRNKTLTALAHSCTQLEFLDVSWCTFDSESFPALATSPIATSLRSLSISWCNLLDSVTFEQYVTCFYNLTKIDVSWRTLTDHTVEVP